MKKLGLVLCLTLMGASSLFADYQLTLIDKDGTETKQCIKSYSFSNNLESLARKNGLCLKDVYSNEETLTNKIWYGKRVYRKMIEINRTATSWKEYLFDDNITITSIDAKWYSEAHEYDGEWNAGYTAYTNLKSSIQYVFRNTYYDKVVFRVEYTKDNDVTDSSANTFKSFIHYTLSSSEDEEVTTKDMKNLGVQILENYTYDKDTDSCTVN